MQRLSQHGLGRGLTARKRMHPFDGLYDRSHARLAHSFDERMRLNVTTRRTHEGARFWEADLEQHC